MMRPLTAIKHGIRAVATPFFKLRRKLPIETENISVKVKDLPQELCGCRIAVVADLHLPDNIADTDDLLSLLTDEKPDCILLAGDLTNRYNKIYPAETAAFLQHLAAIAPVYAIAGNHETAAGRLPVYRTILEQAGICFLEDAIAHLNYKGESLYIYGVCDREKPLPQEMPFPAILLVHYPECAVKAATRGCICAVCGHAHGGQVRFGKRGLFSPGQGFFPRYISGLYATGDMPVLVSRGLGDSSLPIRIYNRPHLPIITLKRQ